MSKSHHTLVRASTNTGEASTIVHRVLTYSLLTFGFRLVSEVVRKALQAQKAGDNEATDVAENCLHRNRQFADLISLLPAMVNVSPYIYLLFHDTTPIAFASLTNDLR